MWAALKTTSNSESSNSAARSAICAASPRRDCSNRNCPAWKGRASLLEELSYNSDPITYFNNKSTNKTVKEAKTKKKGVLLVFQYIWKSSAHVWSCLHWKVSLRTMAGKKILSTFSPALSSTHACLCVFICLSYRYHHSLHTQRSSSTPRLAKADRFKIRKSNSPNKYHL